MGRSRNKNKNVDSPAKASEMPPVGRKNHIPLQIGARIGKISTDAKTVIPDTINIKDIKKDVIIKVDGSKQVSKQTVASTKEKFDGVIFMCNGRTRPDCFRYKVMGFPQSRKEFVLRIQPGMKLFLYDIDSKLLYGIFKASSAGGMFLEPAAFSGSYPAQVHFEVEVDCAPLPEHIFKNAIKDNYTGIRNMFNVELSSKQVGELTKIFQPLPQLKSTGPVAPLPQPPIPAPAAAARPTILPVEALIPPNPFEIFRRSHIAPQKREAIQVSTVKVSGDPLALKEREYRSYGLKQTPLMVTPPASLGNATDAHILPYRAAPYETTIMNHAGSSQIRLDGADYLSRPWAGEPRAPQPAPHAVHQTDFSQLRLGGADFPSWPGAAEPLAPQPAHITHPYDVLRMSVVERGGPGAAVPRTLLSTHAANAASAYDLRNEHQVSISGYRDQGSLPVSSRYAFAGPAFSYKRKPR